MNQQMPDLPKEAFPTHVIYMEIMARKTAYLLDPRLNPRNQELPAELRENPDPRIPQDVLDSARDLLDCLDGERTPPKHNRLGISHVRAWDTNLVMHQLKDLACEMDEAGPEFPPELYLKVLRSLLDLAVSIAQATSWEETHSFLDALVQGPDPS